MPGKLAQFFYNQFKKNEAKIHELTYLFWECTRRCNLQCLHCGSDCSSHPGIQDMPFDDFLGAILPIKNACKPERITITITGGEPLMRPDLPRCGKILRGHGFHWGIVTNGYAYTPDVHAKLLDAGMESLTISLDGFESSHNWLRAGNKSFKNALRALSLIASADGLVYDVVTCVNRRNIRELPDFKEFLISHNVKAWRLFTIAPVGRAAMPTGKAAMPTGKAAMPAGNAGQGSAGADMRLSGEELSGLMEFISSSRSDSRIKVQFSCEAYVGKYECAVRDYGFFCRAGINIASVLIDGSISACPNISRHFAQGNIYHDDFLETWDSRFEIMRDRAWTKTGLCLGCKDYKNCRGGAMHLWDEKQDSPLDCISRRLLP